MNKPKTSTVKKIIAVALILVVLICFVLAFTDIISTSTAIVIILIIRLIGYLFDVL